MNITSAADAGSQAVSPLLIFGMRSLLRQGVHERASKSMSGRGSGQACSIGPSACENPLARRSREEEDMAIQLKHRLPTGETRPWTLKEIIQGRPVDRPTHPMLVHFPIAFYIGALVVDVISRIWTFPSAPLMATWLLIGAFVGTAGAATT